MSSEVTLDQVARASGVSRATASRALNGRDGVRDDVRERVRVIANSLGYRPNRSAQNLAGGRSSVLGFVLGSPNFRIDTYAASLVQSMASAASEKDEGLMLLVPTNEPGRGVRSLLHDGLVDGVMISAAVLGEQWIEQLLDADVPTVLVGAHPRRSDIHVVDVGNRAAAASMVGHLLDTGGERVATVTGRLERVDAQQRLEGYRDAHSERGLLVDESLIVEGDFTRRSGYELADSLIDREPNAIFAANDESAIGILRRAEERGLAVPDAFSLAGFDGTAATELTGPRLSTVQQPFDELAATAVRSLITLIEGGEVPKEQLVPAKLDLGETTRPSRR